MAAACASAFDAEKLIFFLTDVEGVRDEEGATRATLTVAGARELIAAGIARRGGMRAKLEGALCALQRRVTGK